MERSGDVAASLRPAGSVLPSLDQADHCRTTKENVMGLDDKAKNKTEELKGKGKEAAGRATDDEELEAEGKTDQATSNLKQAGEKVKDVFK